ncbi:hypothetical protein CTI12_AA582210 [Artemisia annua]|uniref:Uncharacterized protein n=1 Tax=Artemisia annua TaxID=35608 RepID=A0A2U1KNQ6_ARTAN|nr:hypothetical protein CTI12_AA582210 [Artemisia annua]
MQSQQKIEVSGLSPSFSFYFSDSLTSKAVTKVIREEHFGKDESEFSFVLNEDDEDSSRDIYARYLTAFPIFNRGQDGEVKPKDDKIDISSSYSSSELEERS